MAQSDINHEYDPLFDHYGRMYNVDPALTKTLFHIESSGGRNTGPSIKGDPDSPIGPMQIRPSTGRGLGANDVTDYGQAIAAATKYIREGLDKTGTPQGAALYYHGGPDQTQWGPKTQAYAAEAARRYPSMQLVAQAPQQSAPPHPGEDVLKAFDAPASNVPPQTSAPAKSGLTGEDIIKSFEKAYPTEPPGPPPTTPNDISGQGRDEYGRPLYPLAPAAPVETNGFGIPTVADVRNALKPEPGWVPSGVLPMASKAMPNGEGDINAGVKWDLGPLRPVGNALLDAFEGTGLATSAGGQNSPLAGKVSPELTMLLAGAKMGNPNPLQATSKIMAPPFSAGPATSPGQIQARIEQNAPLSPEFKASPGITSSQMAMADAPTSANPLISPEGRMASGNALAQAKMIPAQDVIPNGLTSAQIEEFKAIPREMPPTPEIRTRADAEGAADKIINHFASIGNKAPLAGAEGALPTITGNAGLATLYRTVRASDTPVPFTMLEDAAKAKHGGALAEMVKTPETADAMEAAVNKQTTPMRDAVFANKGEADPTPTIQTMQQILASPAGQRSTVVSAVKEQLAKLVDKDGNILPKARDPEQLYGIDKSIRDSLSPLARGTTSDARLASHELGQVMDSLRGDIEAAAPGFGDYMAAHSELMRPVNEMRYLQSRKLTNIMDETTLGKLSGMLDDIARQQRLPGLRPADSLSPETMQRLQTIRAQMQREYHTMTGGRDMNSTTFQHGATNTTVGRIAGGAGNALVGGVLGGAADFALGGGGAAGVLTGQALAGGLRGLSESQKIKATARYEAGQKMLMEALRERLLNIDNKGVRALSNR